MTSDSSKRKIKNYLLFPHIQVKFLLAGIISLLLLCSILLWQIYSSFDYLQMVGEKMQLTADSGYFKLLKVQKDLLLNRLMWGAIIGSVIAVLINIKLTHSALGPFYRLKVFFQNYQKGRGDKIKFRDSDYFKDLESDINRSLD